MSDEPWVGPLKSAAPDEVAIDYIKATDFRVVWADGAMGGLTPSGLIHFALYSERPAIPRRQVFSLEALEGGVARLGPEVPEKRLSRDSIVREMACDVLITPAVAEQLATWLTSQVEAYKKAQGDS